MNSPFPRQLILGHRGAPREATENTLRSLSLAVQRGADGVELDVQRSGDGVPVVIHDDDLDRTMSVSGRVARLSWAAIERLTLAQVPSFEQVVAWAAASGAWLNVEVKAAEVEAEVIRLLLQTGLKDRTILSSFEVEIVRRLGEVGPSFRRFLLLDRWEPAARERVAAAGAQGVCLRVDQASAATLSTLGDLGLPVIVWTVNESARIRDLLESDVAALITDDPVAAVRIRAELGRD